MNRPVMKSSPELHDYVAGIIDMAELQQRISQSKLLTVGRDMTGVWVNSHLSAAELMFKQRYLFTQLYNLQKSLARRNAVRVMLEEIVKGSAESGSFYSSLLQQLLSFCNYYSVDDISKVNNVEHFKHNLTRFLANGAQLGHSDAPTAVYASGMIATSDERLNGLVEELESLVAGLNFVKNSISADAAPLLDPGIEPQGWWGYEALSEAMVLRYGYLDLGEAGVTFVRNVSILLFIAYLASYIHEKLQLEAKFMQLRNDDADEYKKQLNDLIFSSLLVFAEEVFRTES